MAEGPCLFFDDRLRSGHNPGDIGIFTVGQSAADFFFVFSRFAVCSFVFLLLLLWKRHEHPLNLFLLSGFTLTEAIIVGAGIGGLVSALLLAHRGLDVTLVESADAPGGKMRHVQVDGAAIDSGPTVFTMRPRNRSTTGPPIGTTVGGACRSHPPQHITVPLSSTAQVCCPLDSTCRAAPPSGTSPAAQAAGTTAVWP